MASSTLQIIALLLCVVAGLCSMIAIILPNWRQNDVSDDIIEAIVYQQGLWIRCVAQTTGIWQCDDYDSFFLGLPIALQVARGLAIASLVCIFFGALLSIFGMQCTKCMESTERTKARVAMAAGGFWIVSALTVGIAASYYAHLIVQDYNFAEVLENQQGPFGGNNTRRYIFGNSLFLGWAAMVIGTIGGALLMCGSRYVETDEEEYWNRGKVGQGVRRVRNSFRNSFHAIRPSKYHNEERDYI